MKRIKEYKELHQTGHISLSYMPEKLFEQNYLHGDFGIQIAEDGRVWVCIDGIAFLRFKPGEPIRGEDVREVFKGVLRGHSDKV